MKLKQLYHNFTFFIIKLFFINTFKKKFLILPVITFYINLYYFFSILRKIPLARSVISTDTNVLS